MMHLDVANVYTEIDPSKPLPEKVHVRFPSGKIEHIVVSCPLLPSTCEFCKKVGHNIKRCPVAPITCNLCKSLVHTIELYPRQKRKPLIIPPPHISQYVIFAQKQKSLRKSKDLVPVLREKSQEVKGTSLVINKEGNNITVRKDTSIATSRKGKEKASAPLSLDSDSSSYTLPIGFSVDGEGEDDKFMLAISKRRQ